MWGQVWRDSWGCEPDEGGLRVEGGKTETVNFIQELALIMTPPPLSGWVRGSMHYASLFPCADLQKERSNVSQ